MGYPETSSCGWLWTAAPGTPFDIPLPQTTHKQVVVLQKHSKGGPERPTGTTPAEEGTTKIALGTAKESAEERIIAGSY